MIAAAFIDDLTEAVYAKMSPVSMAPVGVIKRIYLLHMNEADV